MVRSSTARDPAARYQTPAEVVTALMPFGRLGRKRRQPVANELHQPEALPNVRETSSRTPASTWFLSCVLLVLGFSTVLFVGAAAFVVFFFMYRSQ